MILVYLNINYGFGSANYWADQYTNGLVDFKNLLFHMFYVSAYDLKYQNTIIGVEWTLAVEVFYYVLFGAMLCLPFRKISKATATIMLGFCLFLVSMIFNDLASKKIIDDIYVLWLPAIYGYMFALGGGAFYIRKSMEESFSAARLSIISDIAMIVIVFIFYCLLVLNIITDVKLFIALLSFFALCFVRDNGYLSFFLTNPMIVFLGSMSFSFYLWHMLILNMPIFMIDYFVGDVKGTFLYKFAITSAISFFWYLLFERFLYIKIKRLVF